MPEGKQHPDKKNLELRTGADWTFESQAVAAAFDDHVREQLPWYDLATSIVAVLARHYVPRGGIIYDIGAANGNIARAIEPTIVDREASMFSVEASAEMAATFHGPGTLIVADAAMIGYEPADLIVSFLSLIFVDPARRSELIARLRSSLKPGGAMVIVEKFEPEAGYVSVAMQRLILQHKLSAGAAPGQVLAKEMSLAGIQRPLALAEVDGFRQFFRVGDFAGWLYERPLGR